MSAPRILHVRINDAETGQPIPARVRFTDAGGRYLAPLGRLTRFATAPYQDVGGNLLLDGREYAYIDGTCEIAVAPGLLTVELSRGPEYFPVRRELSLSTGQMAIRLSTVRWCGLREEGWISGDARAHALSPHAALLEAAAEDLAVVNLLATEHSLPDGTSTISNITAFSGQRPALETPGHLVAVNTLNRHAELGQLALLNCHRVVYPLSLGKPEDLPVWSMADWCDQCHRKGGLVVWADFAPGHEETLARLLPGRVDALELCRRDHWQETIDGWYRLLNRGLQIPLVGSSGKDSNEIALGWPRTYARLEGSLINAAGGYPAWIEAVRAGRTFVTSGPLLDLQVTGQAPGSTVCMTGPLHVDVTAQSLQTIESLDLVLNGKVIGGGRRFDTQYISSLSCDVTCDQLPAWLAARCESAGAFAHTSPVYIEPSH